MSQKYILITGASGGIGRSLVYYLLQNNYFVIATDEGTCPEYFSTLDSFFYVSCDLSTLSASVNGELDRFLGAINSILDGKNIYAIIHNAAYQLVCDFSHISHDDWMRTLHVNLLAPIAISKAFLNQLKASCGSIVHISSIHNSLTKPRFTAYATSKAALTGLTRAMAVELGEHIRINAIEPAAISTPMLEAGFTHDPQLKADLEAFHPTRSIGTPDDVARAVLFLLDPCNSFLNGCVIPLTGGIHSCLHDPAAN